MLGMIIILLVTSLQIAGDPVVDDARALIDIIESLQQPVQDFRCEFEGTLHYRGKAAREKHLDEDGLYDSYSGLFVWKRGGDTHCDGMHRMPSKGWISRETLVVRTREHQAEQYHRLNDAPLGSAVIRDPKEITSWQPGSLGQIFLIDKIKRDVGEPLMQAFVSDEQVEGRPLKVLRIEIKALPGSLLFRYWIDLRRTGHVVRMEAYLPGKVMGSRLDIKLAPFKVGGTEVWMPVHGESVGYGAEEGDKVVVKKEPTVLETIHVVDGTMQFNKYPGREAFRINYKLGTPISDNLRKLQYEFGQQKIGLKPTKAEAQQMLDQQLAKAEEQKSELVAAPPGEGFDWSSWAAWGLCASALVLSGILWAQKRRR